MESPVKKLNFSPADKENQPLTSDVTTATENTEVQTKPTQEVIKNENKIVIAPGIKEQEKDEPLLQENGQRFVLFPIKYHEVCERVARRVKWFPRWTMTNSRLPDLANVQEGRGFLLDR